MKALTKHYIVIAILVAALTCCYAVFAYSLERHNFIKLIGLCVTLFGLTYILVKQCTNTFWVLASVAILVRLVFLPAIPNLSQDFYRFIWDGRLLIQGINPYLTTVQSYMMSAVQPVEQAQALFAGMGNLNASHYTNYPPLNQLCFAIAGWLFPKSILGSVIVLRSLIICADLGVLYFGKKLLSALDINQHMIFMYVLNPFIVIELTGNLHFEGVMLFFFIWAMYLLYHNKRIWSGILIGLSIAVKLIPLLLLPLFLKYFKSSVSTTDKLSSQLKHIAYKKLTVFYIVILATTILTFVPFMSFKFLDNFTQTIGLWFQNFEFNASIYYIIRWIGFEIKGWNIIGTVGKVLPVLIVVVILAFSVFRKHHTLKQLFVGLLFGVSIYFWLSTTVHPWYVATPLLLCVFTKYRFPILWSFTVFLSYSAYGKVFDENLWLVAIEYIVVIGFAIWEIFIRHNKKHLAPKLQREY